jgi:hypothetical protein
MTASPDALRRFGAILGADLRERTRSVRFWLLLGAITAGAWWMFPARDAGYLVLAINGAHRGVYSSAWIGMVTAQVASTMLGLFGFYVVRGTLARDIDTRVWQLLVATPMTRAGYLFAKAASHLVVLLVPAFAALGVGLVAQFVRAEDTHVDLVELVKPLLLLTLPSLALTSMWAVGFDLVPWLRRTGGNVLYFVLWIAIVSASQARAMPQVRSGGDIGWLVDPGGIGALMRSLERLDLPELGGRHIGGLTLGNARTQGPVHPFAWSHWDVHLVDLASPLVWLAAAAAGLFLASLFLDRGAAQATRAPGRAADRSGLALRWLGALLRPLQRSAFGTLVAAEVSLVLRQRRRLWWVALVVAWGVQLFAPRPAMGIAALAGWMLVLDAFGGAVLRDRDARTEGLVLTAPGAARRLVLARGAMAAWLAVFVTAPALVRLAVSAPAVAACVALVGASLAAWGLALGAVTRTTRVFEAAAVSLAYASLNGLPALNVAVAPSTVFTAHLVALPLAAGLLVASGLLRRR